MAEAKTKPVAFPRANHNHAQCVDTAIATADAHCHAHGLRLTPIRRRVLELVWSHHGPIKAYDVLEQLRGERERVDPPTVYRALDFLLQQALIHRLQSLNAFVGCRAAGTQAHSGQFLICQKCHSVAEFNDPSIARLLTAKTKQWGFAAATQTIEISGLCPRCQA